MNKAEFLAQLQSALSKLPESEVSKSLAFYAEMIDDRMEEGESEQDAVAAMGDPYTIAHAIIEELPAVPKVLVKSKTENKTLDWVLAILLSPIWVPLALSFAMVVILLYMSIWLIVASIWLMALCFLLCLPVGAFVFFHCVFTGALWAGLWQLGAGIFVTGIGIFCLYGAIKTTAILVDLSKRYTRKVRSWFKKEAINER